MRRRLRKFILVVGTLLCVLIAAAFAVSARWQFAYKYPRLNWSTDFCAADRTPQFGME